jgi:uncharacterized membrane-anchored protein
MTKLFLTFLLICVLSFQVYSEADESQDKVALLISKLKYRTGKIELKDKIAELNLSENFKYLDPEQTKTVLVDIWANQYGDGTLGLIVDKDFAPGSYDSWAIVITYEEDGYVKDDEAKKINYDDLLKEMKKNVENENGERKKNGYSSVQLVGWASKPEYDPLTHKMFWAKEIQFEGDRENTLNYNIRILGRKGVLVLNAVAGMSRFEEIEKLSPGVLAQVNFTAGNRYEDFDKKTDKMADYGLAAMIIGGSAVAAKVGLFKGLWIAILAAKKFIIIGLIAIGGFLAKLFAGRRKKNQTSEIVHQDETSDSIESKD